MKNYSLSISFFILLFLFLIFTLTNIGFLVGFSVNLTYIPLSFLISIIYLYKSGSFFKKLLIVFFIFLISLILSNLFIDTSFDGRCYHFTIENLFKSGFNPLYSDIKNYDIHYNLLFALNYPNALELLRSNFYLLFSNMESSKIVNFLSLSSVFLYSFYFFLNKHDKFKSFILSLCVVLCAVSICQINTKMGDFFIYFLFIFQLLSLYLFDKKNDPKVNLFIFIISGVLSIASKYSGLLNTIIIFSVYFIYKFIKKEKIEFKPFLIIVLLSSILCFQPYFTNIIKHKNPFYPSIGFNKLDFMTKQNPEEFINKPYIYKFFRSMFSSSSDSRISNPQTPRLYYKIPFTNHFDMPYIAEDVRISGFGHLFSGIFIISVFYTIYLYKKRKGFLILTSILLSTLLNPICWWARFVPQLHLLCVFCCYWAKRKIFFYILSFLIIINGLWILKENLYTSAYKTFIMRNFYNEAYEKSKENEILIYKDKTPYDEDDETIIPRLREYGVNFRAVDYYDEKFSPIKTDCTISKSYKIKY